MLETIKNAVRLVLKNFSFLLILFVLFANNVLRAEEAEKKFIGFIDSLEGSINKEDVDDLIKLNAFDQVFTNDKIKIGPDSSIVVSFIDNSILTLQSDSEFLVEKFDKISEEPSFIIAITKGKFAFESGTIAKNDKGIMKIKLGEMEIDLKGTAITGGISDAGDEITIALVEDTMKNVGEISVTAGDETITITEAHAGLKLSEDKSMETTTMSEEEIIEAADAMSKAVVQASTIDPKKIERAIMKQLAEGKSGLTNLADVETLLAEISSFQDDKRESIVAASGEDVSILSEIIVNSESDQSLQMMEGLMENNAESAALLMAEIVEQDFDIFLHVAKAETGNFETLRETIVTEMIKDEGDFVADTMAQMMVISNAATSSYMINEIANIEGADTAGANLAMDVLSSFSETASEKMAEFFENDPNMMNALTTHAFEYATEEDVDIISDMMQESTGENTAFLMATMVEHKAEMIGDVYKNLAEQDFDLFHHIEQPTEKRTQAEKEADRALKREERAERREGFMPDPESMMDSQEQFIDSLKGDIYSEIVSHSEETTADVTADLMMNSRGDSAMFMMEIIIEDNPELVANVMLNFIEEDFDIFEHFEETYEDEEPTIVEMEGKAEATAPEEKKNLTKEERQAIKIEKKADKERAREEKIIAKQAKKEAKALEKQLKKEEKMLAKLLNLPEPEEEFEDPIYDTGLDIDEDPEFSSAIHDIKSDIIGEMFQHGGASTVAKMIAKSDDMEESEFILDIVMEQIAISNEDGDLSETQDHDFMDEVVEHLADESPDTLLVMSEENIEGYEGIVKDRSDEGISSEDLVEEIEDSEHAKNDLNGEQDEDYYAGESEQGDFTDEGEQDEDYYAAGEDFIDEDEDEQEEEDDYAYLYEYEETEKRTKEEKKADRAAKKADRVAKKEAKEAQKAYDKEQKKIADEYQKAYLLTQQVTAPTWGAYYTYLTDRELGSMTLPYQYLYAEKGSNNTDLEFVSSDLTDLGLSLTTESGENFAAIGGTLPSAGDYNFDVFVRDSVEQAKVSPTLKFYFTVDAAGNLVSTAWTDPSYPEYLYDLGTLSYGSDPYYDGYYYTSFFQTLEASTGPSPAEVNYRLSPDQVKEYAFHPANALPTGLTVETTDGYGSIQSSEITESLEIDTDFTFTVRAEEIGADAPKDEQDNFSDWNDRNFRVTISADPAYVSPG